MKIKEQVEFKGLPVQITVEDNNNWIKVTYPCNEKQHYGDKTLYIKYHNHYKHLNNCLACKVVLGISKAKILKNQQQVVNLYELDYEGFKSDSYGTVKSENGYLLYNGDIRALRTNKGIIVNSQLDRVGFGLNSHSVPKPTDNVIAELPLGAIQEITRCDFTDFKTITVLDKTTFNTYTSDTLITILNKTLLVTTDKNHEQYVIELPTKPRTVNDAHECLKPVLVKSYESVGVKVQRQGEYYFIPTKLTDKHITNIKRIKRITKHKQYGTELISTELVFPTVDNKPETHHVATKYGSYHNIYDVVKGTVRHVNNEHKMLKLPLNQWCIVQKNLAVKSVQVRSSHAD